MVRTATAQFCVDRCIQQQQFADFAVGVAGGSGPVVSGAAEAAVRNDDATSVEELAADSRWMKDEAFFLN